MAQLFQELDGAFDRVDAVRVHAAGHGRLRVAGDAQLAWLRAHLFQKGTPRRLDGVGRAALESTRRIQQGGAVAHAERDRVLDGEAVPMLARAGTRGRAPARRLHAEQTAARGGDADRSTAVAAVSHGHRARRHQRRRATARAARGAPDLPGRRRGSEGRGLGHGHQPELGRVGLADGDQPCLALSAVELRGHGRLPATVVARAALRGHAGHSQDQILQHEGHAREHAIAEGLLSHGAGLHVHAGDHGVELGVHALDTRDGLLDQIRGAHLAPSHQLR